MSTLTARATSTSVIVATATITVSGSTFFCFITQNSSTDFTTAYNSKIAEQSLGSGTGTKTATFTGLSANTTYYVWIYGFGAGQDNVKRASATTWKNTSTLETAINGAVSIAISNSTTITGAVYVEESGPFPPRPPIPTVLYARGIYGTGWGDGAWGGLSIGTKQDVATIIGQVRIAHQNTNAITGAVRIWKSADKSISGSVNVKKTFSKSITGAVDISAPSYDEITGCVNIYKHDEEVGHNDIVGSVRITKPFTQNITGVTRIAKPSSKNISGTVRIMGGETTNISGLVRIVRYGSDTISGRVRIKVAVPEKLPEEWEYTGLAEPEDWGKEDKTSTGWEGVEKPEDEWAESEKEATNWNKTDTGAVEWDYPLEDTA